MTSMPPGRFWRVPPRPDALAPPRTSAPAHRGRGALRPAARQAIVEEPPWLSSPRAVGCVPPRGAMGAR